MQVNINIMRAFVAVRRLFSGSPADKCAELQQEMKKLKEYMEEVFAGRRKNEDTRGRGIRVIKIFFRLRGGGQTVKISKTGTNIRIMVTTVPKEPANFVVLKIIGNDTNTPSPWTRPSIGAERRQKRAMLRHGENVSSWPAVVIGKPCIRWGIGMNAE